MDKKRKDIFFIAVLVISIMFIIIFNYVIDPYYIFRNSTINGINDVKTHKYTNKRSIIYSDIKLNSNKKENIFIGNCVLSNCKGLNNIGFFTLPVVRTNDVLTILKNIKETSSDVKTVYWGILYDDFLNLDIDGYNDKLPKEYTKKFDVDDFTNLFFSWNTTKYSFETLRDSIKNKERHIEYVYPYRGIANREYNKEYSLTHFTVIQEAIEYAKENNIELIFYYSPIHISKKIHIYQKGQWDSYIDMKKRLAEVTPYYDYSLTNDYNAEDLDENNNNFVDNVHPTCSYNNSVVNDLIKDKQGIGILITKENVNKNSNKETDELLNYMNNNPSETNKIKFLTSKDSTIKIKKQNK